MSCPIESARESISSPLASLWGVVDLMLLVERGFDKDPVLATNRRERPDLGKLAPVEQEVESTPV